MKTKSLGLALPFAFAIGLSAANAAIVTNGDFETGNLTGWTVNAGTDPSHPPIVIGYNNTNGFPKPMVKAFRRPSMV